MIRGWIRRHRGAIWWILVVGWLAMALLVFVGRVPLWGRAIPVVSGLSSQLRIGIFSTLIAVGLPALYRIHSTWVEQPAITTDLEYVKTVTLMNRAVECQGCGWDDLGPQYQTLVDQGEVQPGGCPRCGEAKIEAFHLVIPTLIAKLLIRNTGEETARDAFVTFEAEEDEQWHGRWSVPENLEKFDLHPKDERGVHIFRTYIGIDAEVSDMDGGDRFVLADHTAFRLLDDGEPDFDDGAVAIRSQHPVTERPWERGESSFAGWPGNRLRIPPTDEFTITYTVSAEDWYREQLEATIQLDDQLTDSDLWQEGWKTRFPTIVDKTESHLSDVLN